MAFEVPDDLKSIVLQLLNADKAMRWLSIFTYRIAPTADHHLVPWLS